jgi:hypothetical protein
VKRFLGCILITATLAEAQQSPITIDYPEDGSIFPPEITAPTFIWRDPAESNTSWLIDVAFADGSAAIHARSRGERLRIGEIDPRCIAESNQPPRLTPREAAAHSWTPDAETWAAIKKHPIEHPATLTITGLQDGNPDHAVSRGHVTIQTSKDPVGAPVFAHAVAKDPYPEGRWLVFSSKSRSPYTQMFLTHLDEQGSDSPAILIGNVTAANRAVNIPESLNVPQDGLLKIDVPAAEFYRLVDDAHRLAEKGQRGEAIAEWRKALELNPGDARYAGCRIHRGGQVS